MAATTIARTVAITVIAAAVQLPFKDAACLQISWRHQIIPLQFSHATAVRLPTAMKRVPLERRRFDGASQAMDRTWTVTMMGLGVNPTRDVEPV